MTRKRDSRERSRRAGETGALARRAATWGAGAAAAAVVALALVVHRRALFLYFNPDDFTLIERARGMAPTPLTVWRVLSGVAYWHVAWALFGGHPLPYHAVMWALHGLNVALVYALARSLGATVTGASLGAALFGVHPALANAVYPASSFGELAALALALGALLLAARPSQIGRVAAGVLFLAALLCKESVALVPLACAPAWPGGRREWIGRVLPLMIAAVAVVVGILLTRHSLGALGGSLYAWTFGPHLAGNLAHYTGAWFDLFHAAPDPDARWTAPVGALAVLVLAAGAAWQWRTSRLAALGLAGWIVGLAPVLPLAHVRYAHYMYAPGAFLAMACAALAEPLLDRVAAALRAFVPRPARPATAVMVIALVIVGLAWQSDRMLARRAQTRMAAMDLPFDSMLRKMEFARRVIEGVREALGGARGGIAWVLPEATVQVVSVRTGQSVAGAAAGAPRYDFAMAVLDSGRAIRAVLPQVDDVRPVHRWARALDGYLVITNATDGWITVHGIGPDAQASVARQFWDAGLRPQAITYMRSVVAAGADSSLAVMLARMEAAGGSAGAR